MPFKERPYTEGTPCTACPLHLTGCTNKMCTVQTPTTNTTTSEAAQNAVEGTTTTTGTATTEGTTTTTAGLEVKTRAPGTVIPSTNMTAPPLLTMPPMGYDIITNPYTTPEPTMIPTLLPNHCTAPSTPELRESCWREAWMLWTNKYNQWAGGQCEGQRTTPHAATAGGGFVA